MDYCKRINNWDIHTLAKYVDVITWSNLNDLNNENVLKLSYMDEDWDISKCGVTALGNVAYIALFHEDENIRSKYLNILINSGKLL